MTMSDDFAEARCSGCQCHGPLVHLVLALVDRASYERARVDVFDDPLLARNREAVGHGLQIGCFSCLHVILHLLCCLELSGRDRRLRVEP